MTLTEGPGLVARLRDAVRDAPDALHFVVYTGIGRAEKYPPPLGERRVGADVTVIAVPVTDTCKEVVEGLVRRTIPRDTLVDARGPWSFQREALVQALDRLGTGADISNLIELCQAARLRVRVLTPQ